MVTRYGCEIDGLGLQDIDPTVYITDISESAPVMRATAIDNATHDGLYLTRLQRQSLAIAITFEVHEYDTARRKAVAEAACGWAKDGWLTINDRPGQRLFVVCDRFPVVPSSLKWTDKITLGFTAYALPFWQEAYSASASVSGAGGKCRLSPAGNMDCYLEAKIRASSGTVNSLTVAANGQRYAFTGLGLQSGQTLEIGYDDAHHRQYMRIGGASVLSKRTAESADDIMLHPRTANEISVTADGAVTAQFYARGLYR